MYFRSSKLRTYSVFKNEIGIEKYLINIKNTSIRKQICKFRLSNHALRIETGRYDHTPSELRLCPFCKPLVENETHFLFDCSTYNTLRNTFISKIVEKNPDFMSMDNHDKLAYIMTNIDIDITKYISKCLELRSFLVKNPKRNI